MHAGTLIILGPTYACNFGSQEHPHAGRTRQESMARRTMDLGIPSPHRNGPPVRRPSSPRRPMSRSSNVMKCHALPMPATTHVRLQKGGPEQMPVRYAYNQQTIYHNFELTCLMLQYRDINSITIVDRPAVRPHAVVRQLVTREATQCTRQDHTCISERHDEAGTITTADCRLSTRMFLRRTRLTCFQAVAMLLAAVNGSTPSSVSTRTAYHASTHISGPMRYRSSYTTACSGMWMEMTLFCVNTFRGWQRSADNIRGIIR